MEVESTKLDRVASVLPVRTPLPVRPLSCGNDHALAVIGLIIAAAAFDVTLVAVYIASESTGLFIDRLNAGSIPEFRWTDSGGCHAVLDRQRLRSPSRSKAGVRRRLSE